MNKERMLLVADAIEREEFAKFNMDIWLTFNHTRYEETHDLKDCGTVACVAGFTYAMFKEKDEYPSHHDVYHRAREMLDVEFKVGQELFTAPSMNIGFYEVESSGYEYNVDYIDGIEHVNFMRTMVPDAIRWMVTNDKINWKEAFEAVGTREIITKVHHSKDRVISDIYAHS